MIFRRNETLTGLFVLVTFLVVAVTIAALSFPGLLHRQRTYYVYFDNAGGIEPGSDVLLAGRKVGQVVSIRSPVPTAERPADHPDVEALVKMQIRRDAKVYNSVSVRMEPFGMLGFVLIDIVGGDETSGVAPSGTKFVGERVAGFSDVAQEMTERLEELKTTIENVNELTSMSSELRKSAVNMTQFTDTIKHQPWRLVWRGTKKYPEDEAKEADGKSDRKKKKKD